MRYRRRRGVPLFDALRQDAAFSLRLFRRDRALSLAIVSALSLGIGAAVTVFTILNAMLLGDVPYFRDPDRVVVLDSLDARGRQTGVSFADFLDWRDAASFSAMTAYAGSGGNSGAGAILSSGDQPADRLNGVYVSAGTFELLGAAPALGRGFAEDDDRAGAPMAVVLSDGIWADRFGRDTGAIGRAVRVNGIAATIVGVMPPGFSFPLTGDLWIPLAHMPGLSTVARQSRVLTLVGRLADGVSLAQARAELAAVAAGLEVAHPDTNKGVRPVVVPFVSRYLGTFTTPEPLLLLTAAILVLLITCANASTMLLTRAAGRAREIALRAAVGASRMRLAGQLLVESLVLASISGLFGLALAAGAVRAFAATTGDLGLPAWTRFELDGRVFLFAAAICLGTGLVFGCAPALHLSRRATPLALKDGGRGLAGPARPGRWMRALLAAQVAVALILLAGATNLVGRARALYEADRAVDPAHVLTARLALPLARQVDGEARARLVTAVYERLRELPAVEAVAIASTLPFVGAGTSQLREAGATGDADAGPSVCTVGIAGDYLEVLSLRLLAGRAPLAGESDTVLVNQAFVEAFAGEGPLGRRLRLRRAGWGGVDALATVVGVVPSVRQTPIGDARPCVYVPLAQEPAATLAVMVRTGGRPAALVPATRAALRDLDPDLALYGVRTLEDLSHVVRWSSRTIGAVLSVFGLIAFVLSVTGLYAVTARGVAQRTAEIGVHLALGARRRDVWRVVAGRAVPVVVAGLVLGVAGGAGLTRAMRGLLIGADGGGPAVLGGLAVVVLGVAVLACAVPTRRALRIEPGTALRAE